MELNPKIKHVLEEINFVNRYEILSKKFNSTRTPVQEMLTYTNPKLKWLKNRIKNGII